MKDTLRFLLKQEEDLRFRLGAKPGDNYNYLRGRLEQTIRILNACYPEWRISPTEGK